MWKLILFALLIIDFKDRAVDSAAAILLPQRKPLEYACVDGCYVPELGRMLAYNEKYSPKNGTQCIQYSCGNDGNTGIYTCGVIGVGDGCSILPGNLYLAYPDCCPGITCTDNAASITGVA